MSALTFTCQECGKTGTDRTEFKKIEALGMVRFSFILCNAHAKKHEVTR